MDDFNNLNRQVLDLTLVVETQADNQKIMNETVFRL